MTNQEKDFLNGGCLGFLLGIFLGICFVAIILLIVIGINDNRSSSLKEVTEARFILNDGQSVKALDYSVIIDQENGREYLYFPGMGVTPFIDDNGQVLKVVE